MSWKANKNDTKRGHYVPVTYLKHFSNPDGCLWAYRLDNPSQPRYGLPGSIGWHYYYYARLDEQGNLDANSVEQFMATRVEGKWDAVLAALQQRQRLSVLQLGELITFIGLQHARVPAVRDRHEALRAGHVKHTLKRLVASGELPAPPERLGADGLDNVVVSIDPETSLVNMGHDAHMVSSVIEVLSMRACHNETDLTFITSDNPVCWYDPTVPENSRRPYLIQRHGAIEFFCSQLLPASCCMAVVSQVLKVGMVTTRSSTVIQ